MASCYFYQLLIQECQQQYNCAADSDFPLMTIINYPFADMLTAENCRNNRPILVKQLQTCIDHLAAQGASIIAIACNTLHTILPNIVIPVGIELVHIARITVNKAISLKCRSGLILATSTTIALRLYQAQEFVCIYPTAKEQTIIDRIIKKILHDDIDEKDSIQLGAIISRYTVDSVILGCTELPLLHKQHPLKIAQSIAILDSSALLAACIIQKWHSQK